LLKHEVCKGIRLSIVIFLPKNTAKPPMLWYRMRCKVGSEWDEISLIIERMVLLSLSYSVS
jgi:hypothetical protein